MMLRLDARTWARNRLYARLRDETQLRSGSSAVVFAPHADDETLGCGGTILLKRRAGTPVACVFMTDGSTSHRQYIGADELRHIRMAEAIEATGLLGVPRADVHFMNFEDGRLGSSCEAAIDRVNELLARYRPAEVYVPLRRDGVPDHEHTYAIVLESSRRSGFPLEICEYPIWAWNTWPWVSLRIAPDREFVDMLRGVVRPGAGMRLMRSLQVGIRVATVAATKRKALAAYRSQMQRPTGAPDWPVLRDVSDGEFLECMLGNYEPFCCTAIGVRR
jgi:LmbE family N-acetylglucosaminyl deacetylase